MDDSPSSSRRSLWMLWLFAIGMFGFAFALVPLYSVFCDWTGLNGKTSNVPQEASAAVDQQREVTVEFVSYLPPDMNWDFEPRVTKMVVHPGETHTISYFAKNRTAMDSIGQAVPSVSPGEGAEYLNKIECFCFQQQPLAAGEEANLSLVFYVDPELPKSINTLTLAYTLFEAPTTTQ